MSHKEWAALHKAQTAEPGQRVYLKHNNVILLCFMDDRGDHEFIQINGTQSDRARAGHPSYFIDKDTPESDVVIY